MAQRARVPTLELIILLLAALIIFFPAISQILPSVPSLSIFERSQPVAGNVTVWVNLRSGFYYCSRSPLYGKQRPGRLMTQRKAREAGYSPAQQKPCE